MTTRLAHVYVASDSERDVSARARPDFTVEEFGETMRYDQDAKRLTSRAAFFARFERETWINELHEVLNAYLQRGRRVLGVGSGFGEHELRFTLLGFDITASDVVEDPLRVTKALFPEFQYRLLDVFRAVTGERWDDVLVTGMDSYFDDERARLLFRGFAALLSGPGAPPKRLIFVLRYKNNFATLVIDLLATFRAALLNGLRLLARGRPRWVRRAHGFRRSRRDIERLAAAAGFGVRRVAEAGFGMELRRFAFLTNLDRASGGLLTKLDKRCHALNNCTVMEFVLLEPAQSAAPRPLNPP